MWRSLLHRLLQHQEQPWTLVQTFVLRSCTSSPTPCSSHFSLSKAARSKATMHRAAACHIPAPALLLMAALALRLAAAPAAARAASFVVEKGSLRIRQPQAITGTFDTAVGDFGVPLYGGTLSGAVTYNASNARGCREFEAPLTPSPGGLPIVLLVDRGDCFFVEKARYGQRAGAKALLVTDHTEEPLLTMAVPEDRPEVAALVPEITIPVVLVTKGTGDKIKSALQPRAGGSQAEVELELDWSESIAHPDNRVEWELWFTTQDACGQACDSMRAFFHTFRETAQALERERFALFTPHVMTQACSRWAPAHECDRTCIHHGRYCAVNAVPQQYADKYGGAQVVEQNKRHLCAHQVLNTSQQEPWRWWDYAAGFAKQCTMAAGRFDAGCAEEALRGAAVDVVAVNACMGPSDTDQTHPVMEAQGGAQVDEEHSGRGRVILLPTLVINADQYRGSLTAPAVLRALCAGFSEGSEPPICLTGGLNVDDCASGTDRCWRGGEDGQLSACVDTFRGYVCRCPAGYEGDGQRCEDVDECALNIAGCDQVCVNTPGSYRCECHSGYTLHGGQGGPGMCIPNSLSPSRLPAWLIAMLIVASVVSVSVAGMFVYRWRLRREMQSEIRSIMREYMPLSGTDGATATAEVAALSESLLPHSERGGKGEDRGMGSGAVEEEAVAGGRDVEGGHVNTPHTPWADTWASSRFASPPALTELTDLPSSPLNPRRLL